MENVYNSVALVFLNVRIDFRLESRESACCLNGVWILKFNRDQTCAKCGGN